MLSLFTTGIIALAFLTGCNKQGDKPKVVDEPVKSESVPKLDDLPGALSLPAGLGLEKKPSAGGVLENEALTKQYVEIVAAITRQPQVYPLIAAMQQERAMVIGKNVPSLADFAGLRKALEIDKLRIITNSMIRDKDSAISQALDSIKYNLLRSNQYQSNAADYADAAQWAAAVEPKLQQLTRQYQQTITEIIARQNTNLVEINAAWLKQQEEIRVSLQGSHARSNLFLQLQNRIVSRETSPVTLASTSATNQASQTNNPASGKAGATKPGAFTADLFKVNGVMIGGASSRAFINGVLIRKGERAEVIAGGQPCQVRCVDIAQDVVTIQVDNGTPMDLKISR